MTTPTWPTVAVQFSFGNPPTGSYLFFDDVTRGKFDTGTFAGVSWTDATADVASFSTNRGRQRQLDRFNPGTANVELHNTAAAYSPTNLSGPYVSAGVTEVQPMVPARIRATYSGTTYDLWRGYADSWHDVYTPGSKSYMSTQFAGSDAFKVFTGELVPATAAPSPTLVSTSTGIASASSVTVTAPAGIQAGDFLLAFVAQGQGTLNPGPATPSGWTSVLATTAGPGFVTYSRVATAGEPASYTFSNSTGDATAYAWNVGILAYRGVGAIQSYAANSGTGPYAIAPAVTTQTANTTNVMGVVDSHTLVTGETGFPGITSYGVTSPAGYTSRIGSFSSSNTNFVDVLDITQAAAGSIGSPVAAQFNAGTTAVTSPQWVCHYFVLTAAAVGAGDDTGARIGRVLDLVGWGATDRNLDTGDNTLQGTLFTTSTSQDEMQLASDSEYGRFYMDPAGKVRYEKRTSRLTSSASTSSNATFADSGNGLYYESITLAYDDTLLKNSVTIQNVGGIAQTATDATSITNYLTRSYQASGYLLPSDPLALGYAEWLVWLFKSPELRVESITLNPLTDANLWPHVLGRKISDRITVTVTPPAGDAISIDCFIEGISHNVTTGLNPQWLTTFQLSSATRYLSGATGFLIFDTGKFDTGLIAF